MIAEKEDRWQFLKFLVAAGLSVPVNLGSRVLLSRVMPYEAALVASHLCGMLTAFLLTRSFVFERSGRRASNELVRFTLVNALSLLVTWVVAVVLRHELPDRIDNDDGAEQRRDDQERGPSARRFRTGRRNSGGVHRRK